jgi:hypothetical protein
MKNIAQGLLNPIKAPQNWIIGQPPWRAGPILSLTYDYCCSNLKDGKLFGKLPFGYSSEEERNLVRKERLELS